MAEPTIGERLATIEAVVTTTQDMIEKRITDLEHVVYGNGKEGLRTSLVAWGNRIIDLERDKIGRGSSQHEYTLVGVFGVGLVVAMIGGLAAAKQMGWF